MTCVRLQVYLNLVLEFVPDTVYRISKHYSKAGQRMPSIYVKLYTYQVEPRHTMLHDTHTIEHYALCFATSVECAPLQQHVRVTALT